MKLDYRCRGNNCASTKACRRHLVGPEAKKATAPFAAFDARDHEENICGFFLPRLVRTPNAIVTGLAPGKDKK